MRKQGKKKILSANFFAVPNQANRDDNLALVDSVRYLVIVNPNLLAVFCASSALAPLLPSSQVYFTCGANP